MLPLQTFRRLLRLWLIHLLFAGISIPVSFMIQFVQSVSSPHRVAQVTLLLGILVTAAYFIVLMNVSAKLVRSQREGLITGLVGALPFVLIILTAMVYLSRVPHNTIGYSYILLPVTLPFLVWMDQVYPALPFHILAFSIPLIFAAATITGSFLRQTRV
jgi:hypothetical protein